MEGILQDQEEICKTRRQFLENLKAISKPRRPFSKNLVPICKSERKVICKTVDSFENRQAICKTRKQFSKTERQTVNGPINQKNSF